MTVLDRKQVTDAQQPERAVFVAEDGRRARRLRRAAVVAALVACLWVVGLGIGMLGFGRLPGVSLVERVFDGPGGSGAHITPVSRNDAAQPASERSGVARRVASQIARGSQPASSSRARARRSTSSPRNPSRPPAAVLAPAPPAQQPVNPAQRQRGWAREGATAPPGQLRKSEPPPPPGTRGQRRGQTPTTTTTTTTPLPPGQAKKAEPPPPPPPPEG